MCYRLVVTPMTMKLCKRPMPTKTINTHELQVCKQQQIASGTKIYTYTLITYNLGSGTHMKSWAGIYRAFMSVALPDYVHQSHSQNESPWKVHNPLRSTAKLSVFFETFSCTTSCCYAILGSMRR